MLEASPGDLEAAGGRIFVRGTPERSVTHDEVAHEVYRNPHGPNMEGVEPALEAQRHFKIDNVYHQPEKQGRFSAYPSWPNGVAACIVEVDPETGYVEVLRYCMVHDAGTIVNPLLADANLHGGVAQGLGAALYEQIAYDESAQPLTATFMDYTIPTAVEVPDDRARGTRRRRRRSRRSARRAWANRASAPRSGALQRDRERAAGLDLRLTELPLTPTGSGRRSRAHAKRWRSDDLAGVRLPRTLDGRRGRRAAGGGTPDGKALAGGMSLVPAMNLGIARPTAVISLNRIAELDYVRDDGDAVRIGAMTRHARSRATRASRQPSRCSRGRHR